MNKSAIKNFAVTARTTLIEAVIQKAYEYEVTEMAEMIQHWQRSTAMRLPRQNTVSESSS